MVAGFGFYSRAHVYDVYGIGLVGRCFACFGFVSFTCCMITRINIDTIILLT